MKLMKKLLFSMLLLFVLVLNVNAAEENLNLWESIVTDLTPNASNPGGNCRYQGTGDDLIDLFIVGNECVATAIKTSNGEFSYVARGDSGSGDGIANYGKVNASVNDTSNTNVLLSEIVELIYDDNSATTMKVKAMAKSTYTGTAPDYVLKAGSSNNALYVYGGFEGETMSGIKFTFNSSRLTYSVTYETATMTDQKKAEALLATVINRYIVEYIMEASPNYNTAITIVSDFNKVNKFQEEFKNKYGQVSFEENNDTASIKTNVLVSGNINNDIISMYNNSSSSGNTGGNAGSSTSGNNGNYSGGTQDSMTENPNTGAFVNVFAIVSLVSVGIVLFLANKRRLFKI